MAVEDDILPWLDPSPYKITEKTVCQQPQFLKKSIGFRQRENDSIWNNTNKKKCKVKFGPKTNG